jgi:hypothetical protein
LKAFILKKPVEDFEMSASAMKELNFIKLKDVYTTSGAATSGCFGPNLPQTKVECTQKLYAHLFYNRGDRSVSPTG